MNTKFGKLASNFLTHEMVVDKFRIADTKCVWDFNTALGDTMKEKYESLYVKIVEVTHVLINKGAKGYFWIAASPEVCSIFEQATTGFHRSTFTCGFHIPLGIPQIYESGMIDNKWKLFVDTEMEPAQILIGVGMESNKSTDYGIIKITNFFI